MDNLKIELVIASTINFGILFFVFYHFLGEKLANMVEKYRKHIKDSEEVEGIVKKKLEKAEIEAEKIIEEGKKQALEMAKSAEDISKYNSLKTVEKAQKEAEYIVNSAKIQIEKEELAMKNSIKSEILNTALKLSSKVFGKEVSNKKFLEKELEKIEK